MYFKKQRISYLVLGLFLSLSLSAQIPQDYYDNAEGKMGDELKTALYNIIKGHTEFPYTASSTDVWDIIKVSDRDPANPDNVILLYSGLSVNAAQEYNNGNGWTREHVWAKVHGDFGTDPGPGTDLHHLRPENDDVNNARNSRWFAECTTPYYSGGVNTGCFTSSSQWVWKPRQQVVGDVARMIFYMATRYEGENGEPNLEVVDYIPSDNNSKEPVMALLKDLLAWNEQDPVDDFERNRNEVIFSYQHNRNPFIDHPEYIDLIWGSNSGPVFTSVYDSMAIVGEPYEYNISVTDNAPEMLVISINEAPEWLHLTSTGEGTATLAGTPTANNVGDFMVNIQAKNGQGATAQQQFYLRVTLGDNLFASQVKYSCLYPNPANERVNFRNNQQINSISIFDIAGQWISTIDNPINGFEVKGLKPGMYIVKMHQTFNESSEILIINN